MPKKFRFFKVLFPVILASITLFLCFKNYTPGTFLLGWDSMHPEFNFPLNIGRMFSHVWAGEQGVGAISAHSDMEDLPRIIFLWATSLVLPASFIRYFYVFVCLILGPLGMYFFLKYVFQREKDSFWVYTAAFLGALSYLLNLGTLQNFYVPLEMFTAAFGGTPWLFLFALKYLREGKKKNLLIFGGVSVLIAPMAYAATQAYAIYFGLFLFLLIFSLISMGRKLKLKRFLLLAIVTLLLNIYWILPNVYSLAQQHLTISNANINRLFSQESFLRNADYGNLANVLIQKSFLFSWRNFDFAKNAFDDLMKVWNGFLGSTEVILIGYGVAGIAILGVIASFTRKEKISISMIFPLILSLFFLLTINPPLGGIYQYLYDHFGVFREGFRTPFTKFSVLFEIIFSFYFGYFCFLIFGTKEKHAFLLKMLATLGIAGALVYFSFPMFSGNLIGKNVRVNFPKEYGQLFGWFSEHPEGRVALMPENSKYGWEYRSWGYEGSGFLTYGIPNPILYRDFDRWNSSNEDFYTESTFALYANDNQSFVSTLKKYNVKYLLLDESIINAGGGGKDLKIKEIKDIASEYGMIEVASFGFLKVYDTGFFNGAISSPDMYSRINANLAYSIKDPFYSKIGDYIDGGGKAYPLASLDTRSGVKMSLEGDKIWFSNNNFNFLADETATIAAKANLSINLGFPEAYNCDLNKLGTVGKSITSFGTIYTAGGGGASCDYIDFPDLKYSEDYVLHITGENKEGRSLKIYLFDSVSQTPYLEEILPKGKFDQMYFIYSRDLKGKDYVLNMETRSFGRIPSKNILTGVEFYRADYQKLSGTGDLSQPVVNNLIISDFSKSGELYRAKVEGSGLLVFDQGYEKGWVGIEIIDNRLKILEHTKVNSWANGWIVPTTINNQNSIIYIFFWPQILEWGGMIFGGVTLVVLIFKKNN